MKVLLLTFILLVGCSAEIETPLQVNNIDDYEGDITSINGSNCKNWEVFGEFIFQNMTKALNHQFSNMNELRDYCDISIDPYTHICESSKLNTELGSNNFTFAWLNCTDIGEGYYTRKKLEIIV